MASPFMVEAHQDLHKTRVFGVLGRRAEDPRGTRRRDHHSESRCFDIRDGMNAPLDMIFP